MNETKNDQRDRCIQISEPSNLSVQNLIEENNVSQTETETYNTEIMNLNDTLSISNSSELDHNAVNTDESSDCTEGLGFFKFIKIMT